ncbi:MAG: DUF2807 domain-containing protein [Flavobacteriales bacterium]|nr:DUF2807 domain-containing protein [Flavobacteriales bacterium]
MKKIITIIVSLVFMSNIFAQTETRAFEEVNALKINLPFKIVLIQGATNKVEISGLKEEYLEKVKTNVENGELSIFTKGKIKSKKEVIITITFKHVNRIKLGGASDISTLDFIREKELVINGGGAIEADFNLEVTNLTIEFSGASDLKLRGLADSFYLKASGASDVKASNFIVKNIEIDISGASDAKVHATESIKGKATGASSISVKGSPALKLINQLGASSTSYGVNRINGYNDDVTIKVGKQHLDVIDDDVDLKLGNKGVIVKDDGDTVKLKWGHTQIIVIDDSVQFIRTTKKRRSHWAGVDLAINGFVNSSNSFDLSNDAKTVPEDITQFMELNYAKSWSFSINFMEFYIPISTHHFGLVVGMGSEWNNYELKHNVKLNAEGGEFVHQNVDEFNKNYTWGEVDTLLDYSKNRFKTWFINAPLLLELNTGNKANKSFHISAGAIFGFNLQTKMKYKYRLNGDSKKEKDKQSFNTNPFRVSATVRAGVGRFNFFATYSLTPLFENGRGPELYPFTVGVTLLGF